ncbi:MAG: Na(+)-translocating NADH-quinone reductase subunit A [Gammaproteobacteria bacterium]|nr:Na(+)-translocating NADH-quinone reductase subunit A [Gammaproteobacteria bacterium]
MIRIKKGLDLPIKGAPAQATGAQGIEEKSVTSVALMGADYPGLKPTFEVKVGDQVTAGQPVFTDKKSPGIIYTAPASGMVSAINRGAKRAFQSLVIDIESEETLSFDSYGESDLLNLDRQKVVDQLVKSGQWTAIRTRPFSKVPEPATAPNAIFVSVMDTRPHAPNPLPVIADNKGAFVNGLKVISRLTEGRVYVCGDGSARVESLGTEEITACQFEQFSGVHPAGLVGTHIHFLEPVNEHRTVWHIGYQDVIAIGHLFVTGKPYFERVVSIGGPSLSRPRIIKTRLGACLDEMLKDEMKSDQEAGIKEDNRRTITGSVLDGRTAKGALAFLGRYHNQVSVLKEGTERELLGFVAPGFDKFSLTRLYMSIFTRLGKPMPLTTSTGGSERAMVPTGIFEEVMPLDILPTQLLRALLVSDVEVAQALGCLELDEEDLALCTFSCAGKYEYGPYLRDMLEQIEKEG